MTSGVYSVKTQKQREATKEKRSDDLLEYGKRVQWELRQTKEGKVWLEGSVTMSKGNPFGDVWIRFLMACIDKNIDPAIAAMALCPIVTLGAFYEQDILKGGKDNG